MLSLLNAISTVGIVFLSIFGALLVGFIVYLCFVPLKTYFTVVFSGCYIPSAKLIGLKSRKFNVKEIALLYVSARKAKINIKLKDIEMVVQSGGNMTAIVEAMTMLNNAGKSIEFSKAVAIEMATKDIVGLAKDSIACKTISLDNVVGTTMDGYEISVNVNCSVKADLDKFEIGIGIDDVKDSLTSYIIDKIAKIEKKESLLSAPNEILFKDINLEEIAKKSMYNLENVNLRMIEVSKDLNAEKEIKSAEKEKIYASIEAERIKNAEEIRLIQTKTKIENMKAEVLQAEAEVPKALSDAIKEGRFSVMDYYKLMNLQADTALRRAIIGDKDEQDDDDDDEEGE